MELGLAGRLCVVTGASRGIGLAIAQGLSAEGARLVLLARDADRLETAARACERVGGGAVIIATDVTSPGAAELVLRACREEHGREPDVLVNNAGTIRNRAPDELTDDDWQAQWDLHVMAPMRLMRALAPPMAARGWGRIVNVASSSGKRPSQGNVAYSVTKAAQLSLSRAWADRWAGSGVLVNAVAPGPVASELWLEEGGLADQTAAARGVGRDEALAGAAERIPLGRFGTPEEIAAVVTFLCSERAADVAGAAWSVDGGAVPTIL